MKLGPYELGPNESPENGIYVGDARELAKAIPDESVDLILTDPPFGIGFDYGGLYEDDPKGYPALFRWLVSESDRIIRPGGLVFVFVAQRRLVETLGMAPEGTRIFCSCKNFVQIRPIPVQYSYDPVLFWQKPGIALQPHSGRDWYVANTNPSVRRGNSEVQWHPCPRPLETIIYMIERFSPKNGAVADFFMGSGTVAMACSLTGRYWWGAEIVPYYANQARGRIKNRQYVLPAIVPEQGQMRL